MAFKEVSRLRNMHDDRLKNSQKKEDKKKVNVSDISI